MFSFFLINRLFFLIIVGTSWNSSHVWYGREYVGKDVACIAANIYVWAKYSLPAGHAKIGVVQKLTDSWQG